MNLKNKKNTISTATSPNNVQNKVGNVIAFFSLIISLLSLVISYRASQLQEMNYNPYFICTTNEHIPNGIAKHTIKNIGMPINNVNITISEFLCFKDNKNNTDIEFYVIDSAPKYIQEHIFDSQNQEIVIDDSMKEYECPLEYVISLFYYYYGVYIISSSETSEFIPQYTPYYKRIMEISYTDRQGVSYKKFFDIRKNYISEIQEMNMNNYFFVFQSELDELYYNDSDSIYEIAEKLAERLQLDKFDTQGAYTGDM